jgi:tellurite resistance protein TerC
MLRFAKRIVVLIIGMTVLLFGVALIFLPGPAFVVIPVGLAILATEFAWAAHWLQVLRESAAKGVEKLNLKSFLKKARSEKPQ